MSILRTRVALLARIPRQTRLASTGSTPPKTNETPNDGTPSSYNIPPKESMTDDPLPKSQNEHPGPVHEEGEEHKKK